MYMGAGVLASRAVVPYRLNYVRVGKTFLLAVGIGVVREVKRRKK